MSTRLSTKLQRMTIDELALEYATISAYGYRATEMSLMGLSLYRLKGVLVQKAGKDRAEELIAQYRDIVKMMGINENVQQMPNQHQGGQQTPRSSSGRGLEDIHRPWQPAW